MKPGTSPKTPQLLRPPIWIAASALSAAVVLALWQTQGLFAAALGLFALAALAGAAWTVARQSSPAASLLLEAAESNPKARLITTADGAFVYANSAFHRLFQLSVSLEAMSGIIVGADSAEAFGRLVAAAAGGMEAEAEISIKGPMDAVEWRRIAVSPLAGGHALWRAEDVTARREMETVRRQEEEMLADFMDHLPAGFFSAGPGWADYLRQPDPRRLAGRQLRGHAGAHVQRIRGGGRWRRRNHPRGTGRERLPDHPGQLPAHRPQGRDDLQPLDGVEGPARHRVRRGAFTGCSTRRPSVS